MVGGTALGVHVFLGIQGTGEEPGPGHILSGTGVNGEEWCVIAGGDGAVALAGDVHDLPVPQFSAAAQGYGPRPDTAQGEGHPFQVVPVIMLQNRPLCGLPVSGARTDAERQDKQKKHDFLHITKIGNIIVQKT